jgi:hypothetical protein
MFLMMKTVLLKVWISDSADEYKPELAQLLYPLFTHLYIRLLHCQALESLTIFDHFIMF